MLTIQKYPLALEESQLVDMPSSAQALDVQFQNQPGLLEQNLCLWVLCDDRDRKVPWEICVYETGARFNGNPRKYTFLGTAQRVTDYSYVVHVFGQLMAKKA